MKNILYLLPFLVLWLSCADRSFLDETVTQDLNLETVFADSTYTAGFLAEIYRDIGFDTDPTRFSRNLQTYGGLQSACDEAKFRRVKDFTDDVMFVTGTVNPVIITDDAWVKGYENIRQVNIFLANVDRSPLAPNLKTIYKAEARFLRAWYYFLMLRHYGGVPLIGDVIYTMEDANAKTIKTERDSFEDCVEYIVSECEALLDILPTKPAGLEGGRAGSGACLGLISRVRLYAASPLFNGSSWGTDTDVDKKLVGYPDYDLNRWKLAMDAAMRVIATGKYGLYVDNVGPDLANPRPGYGFYRMLMPDDGEAPSSVYMEDVFSRRMPLGNSPRPYAPPSLNGSSPAGYPYQEIVDAFPMKDGKAIDESSKYPYSDDDPYKDRDPRFYNSIVMDGTLLPFTEGGNNTLTVINTYKGATQGDAVGVGTPTGYFIKKFTHQTTGTNGIHGQSQVRHLIRYAEVLLNYAEARNEFSGPSDEVYQVLKALRERAGIEPGDDEMYGLEAGMTQDKMRDAIRYERRIELAFEGHRFFDVRRWMIADITENRQMHGMEPTLHKDGPKTYPRIPVYKHVFNKQMYLWPFPDREVAKSPLLKQNPYY